MAYPNRFLFRTIVWGALVVAVLAPLSARAAEKTTLVYSWSSNVGPLNPHLYSPNQMFGQAMVYEPLVRYGEGGRILPWLAERWEVSPDGRTYTFTLRRGVVFSDGTPFNAAAVKQNIDAVLANGKRHAWLELINQIREAVVVNEHTVRLVLKNAYYPALQELALVRPVRFLAPSAFPPSGSTADGLKKPIGTGPWVLTDTKLGEYDIFVRNDRYWGPKPKLERIVVKVIGDPNTRAVGFEAGEIDLIYGTGGGHGSGQISLDTFKRFRETGRYAAQISPPLATRVLALNSNRGPTRELAVRKAVLHAVNKPAIVKGIFLDTERPADALFASNVPYANLDLAPYAYAPDRAGELLDGAGWKRVPGSPYRMKEGQELAVDLCFVGNDPQQKGVAEVIQADLRKAGVRTTLIGEEEDAFEKRQKSGEFGLIFGDTWGAPYDPHAFVSSMRVPSHADYQAQLGLAMKAEIDAKIGQVFVTTDERARQRLYREILTTLHEQAVYLPLTYFSAIMVHRPDLAGATFGATQYEIPLERMGR